MTEEIKISVSSLNAWQCCEQLAKFKLDKWRKPTKSPSALFGDLIHEALAFVYDACEDWNIKPSGENAREILEECCVEDTSLNLYESFWKEWSNTSNTAFLEILEETITKAKAILPAYFDYWHKSRKNKIKVMETEFYFKELFGVDKESAKRNKERKIFVHGYIDGIVKLGREYWILETKTVSRFNPDQLTMIATISLQNKFYIWALNKVHKKHKGSNKIRGVIYNIVKNPAYRGGNIAQKIADACDNPQDLFSRIPISFSGNDHILDEGDVRSKVRGYYDWLCRMEAGEVPIKNDSTYFCNGRFPCPFLECCVYNMSPKLCGFSQDEKKPDEINWNLNNII